uniref:Decapping nuclease n=1 Tax=Caenorhabditis japonica TaxID=281687 RepID=A0A8R1DVX2_CAEJA
MPTIQPTNALSVEVVGYYKRDRESQIAIIKPNQFPEIKQSVMNEKFLRNHRILLEKNFTDEEVEHYMESLFNLLRTNRNLLDDVKFVTFRQIIANVASSNEDLVIQVVPYNERFFICWFESFPPCLEIPLAASKAFWREVTENSSKFQFNPFHKGVFKSMVELSDGSKEKVLYSAELDNYDARKHRFVEVKSTIFDRAEWLKVRGPFAYWQSRLSSVDKIVIGKTKVTHQNTKPFIVIEKISVSSTADLPLWIDQLSSTRTVEDGEQRCKQFLSAVQHFENNSG